MNRTLNLLLLLLLSLSTQAQYAYFTNFAGVKNIGGIDINVTKGGSFDTGGANDACAAHPTLYWTGKSGPGWYKFSCSAPIYSIKVDAHGLNGPDEYLQMYINGKPYALNDTNMTSYTSCDSSGSVHCYLASGLLYSPSDKSFNGGDFTINICSGITSFEIYCNGSMLGVGCHVLIDTSTLAGTILGPNAVCIGDTIHLSAGKAGGVWTSTNKHSTFASGVLTGIRKGVDTIKYTVTNSCGTTTSEKIISIDTIPNAGVIIGNTSFCATDSLIDTVTGGFWSCSGSVGDLTVDSVTGVVKGVYGCTGIITYSLTNACGTANATFSLTVNPYPNAGVITGPSDLCVGNSLELKNTTADSGGIWRMTNKKATFLSGIVTADSAGLDTVVYTIYNGFCTAEATKIIYMFKVPGAGIITGPSTACKGAALDFYETVTGGIWSSSNVDVVDIDVNTGAANALSVGTSLITYTTNTFCSKFVSVLLNVVDLFEVTANIKNDSCNLNNGQISSSVIGGANPYRYRWSNNAITSTIGNLSASTYTLTVTDSNKCKNSNSFIVSEDTCMSRIANVYPNPTQNELTINAPYLITTMAVSNTIGQTISTHHVTTQQAQIDVSYLPAGVYFIKINGTEVRKFVKE